MNALHDTLQKIARQLGELPTTARLLIGSLMVILVMSLILVATYAGQPSMVPLPLELDADSRSATLAYLERSGIRHEDREGRVHVPREQRYTVLAQLTDREVIRGDQILFDSLIEQDSPFLTRQQNKRRWLIAKMNMLSMLISSMNDVRRATVVIDQPDRNGFGSTYTPPTASVTVTPAGDGLTQSQVEAIAAMVSGAQPGMKPTDVRIVDAKNGVRHEPRQDDELTATRNLELQQAAEKQVRAKIQELVSYIPGVRVAVRAQVDTRQVERRMDSYEDPKVGPLEAERRELDSTQQTLGMAPGIQPNTGVSLPSSGGSGTKTTDERSSEKTRPVFPRDLQHVLDRKGYALEINASIGVPRSYFVAIYRQNRNDAEAAPSDAELDPVVTAETARIKSTVEPLVDTGAFSDSVPGDVVVSMIPDMATAMLNAGAGGAGVGSLVRNEGGGDGGGPGVAPPGGGLLKYAALLGLSLLSLAMMFMLVRKAGIQSQLPSAEEIIGNPPPLPTDSSEIVGEAEESVAAMEALELDEHMLQRQQMLGQISEMVRSHPDEVANLLRRWIKVEE